jgi:transposase
MGRIRPATQDGRRLRRYQRRWIVERFFAWMQWYRRLLTHWQFYPVNFLGFVQLGAICILLKQL